MTTVRWARAEAAPAPVTPKVRWTRAAVEGAVVVTPRLRWNRASVEGSAAVQVAALPNLTNVEPETLVTVSAALAGGGSADSWTWRRISGAAVGINAAGPYASFTAPSALDGTSVVIGVTATLGSTTSPERTFTVTVLPQTEWWWTGSGWLPHVELWTAPPAVVTTKPLVGITGGSQSAFDTINGLVGGTGGVRIRRTYNSTLPASWAAGAAGTDVGTGRTSVYSIATVATDSASLAAFSAWVDTIPVEPGVKKIIHIKHEPEDEIAAGTFTLAQWGAAQNAYGAIIRSKGRADLMFGPCFQGPWTFDSRSPYYAYDWLGVCDESLWDVVGLDPYRTSSGTATTWEQMMTVGNSGSNASIQSTMAKMVAWGKPVVFSEFGVFNKPDGSGTTISEAFKISLIQSCYSWAKSWNAAHPAGTPGNVFGLIYFNYTLIGSDEMLSTTAQQQAYAAIVSDSKI